MLEKKCILLLYGKGRYDTSMEAVKEILEDREDCYVIALSDAELYSFMRYRMALQFYKTSNRSFTLINRLRVHTDTMVGKLRTKNSAKSIKPYSEPKNQVDEFFYGLATPYRQLHNAIARYRPDVVLCTTSKLLRDAVKVKYRGKFSGVSVAGLLTDYVLDTRFVNYKANYYFVQNKGVADRLMSLGIAKNKINVIGTPLPKSSMVQYDRAQILDELGIENNKPNIVLVGGRYGADAIKNAFTGVVECNLDVNIIVLTGDNQGLLKYCALVTKTKKVQDSVVIVEDIDDFHKIYAVADILVCSPTACITYEAIRKNIDMILCKGLDKIESGNLTYLVTQGVALSGKKNYDLVESINKLANDEKVRAKLAANRKAFYEDGEAERLADMIEEIAEYNYDKKVQMAKLQQEKLELEKQKLLMGVENTEQESVAQDEYQQPVQEDYYTDEEEDNTQEECGQNN